MRKTLTIPLFIISLGLGLSAMSASADTIQIQLTGFNFKYDGSNIYDSANILGGNVNYAEADPLATVDFSKNGLWIGRLTATDSVYGDLLIKEVKNLPVGGGIVPSNNNPAGFGIDLLQKTGSATDPLLRLNIKDLQVTYSGFKFFVASGGKADSVVFQDLPFGLQIDENDDVTLVVSSSNLTNVTDDATYLTGFDAFGTADINGVLVPEPSSLMALAGMAAIGLLIRRRRHA